MGTVKGKPKRFWLQIAVEIAVKSFSINKLRPKWAGNSGLEQQRRERDEGDEAHYAMPTRVTVGLERGVRGPRAGALRLVCDKFRFGAITATASVPQREIPLDMTLVEQANNQLAGIDDWVEQLKLGRVLAGLLLPDDLRPHISGAAPLVMLMDAGMARIHWEMLAQPEPTVGGSTSSEAAPRGGDFLGTTRSFTRQLVTTFAGPPEPPPPPRRLLRALVVADPAEDARLPGAEDEGQAVADLLEAFNAAAVAHGRNDNRIEVIRLIGPFKATRLAVLSHLMDRSYDLLHYAGHCYYNAKSPAASGWLFGKGEVLSTSELNRIDRIPKFIFANACESGVMPDRADRRSAAMAPSFAESFFARGVTNFVCTAWPVADDAALRFALTLYRNLFGLVTDPATNVTTAGKEIKPMHLAMREARKAIIDNPGGRQSWGAYQHYGNPNLRFFDPASLRD